MAASEEEEFNRLDPIDQLLRVLANRQSPGNITPFSFNNFAEAAFDTQGELLFGKRGKAKRRHYASIYGKYRKRAIAGTLYTSPNYSYWSESGGLLAKSDDLVVLLNPNTLHTSPLRPNRKKRQSTTPRRHHHISTSPPSSPIMANNNKVKVDAYAALFQKRLEALNIRLLCFGEGGNNCDDGIISWTTTETKKQSDNCYHNTGSVLLPIPCREWARHVNPTIFGHGYDNGEGKGISWTSVAYDPALVS